MGDVPVSGELVTPNSTEAWAAYHDIRRRVLFEARGIAVYDANHPDDRSPKNFPKVLVHGSNYIGVVRIDFVRDTAYLRRVAIAASDQRNGFGRLLIRLAEEFAQAYGAKRVESAVALDAVIFYEKCGYRSLEARGGASVQMYKDLVAV